MNIGGFQETSLLDYPGKIAAIIWTSGCNFRCPFCYNKQLVFQETDEIPVDHIFSILEKRKGKLDAVSITGGEPLLHKDITSIISTIKKKGFLVKIDTNGTFPERLEELLDQSLLDYVSMDIKSTKKKYDIVAGCPVDIKAIDTSIKLIQEKAADYEFKTTVIPCYHTKSDIETIAEWIDGSKRYFIQQFKITDSLISESLHTEKPYKKQELQDFCNKIKHHFKECSVRGT